MNDTFSTYDNVTAGVAKVTSAGTAIQFTATATKCRLVRVRAAVGNTGVVVVGDSTALASTGKGYELAPGESIDIRISDLSLLWVDAATSNDKVGYVYHN